MRRTSVWLFACAIGACLASCCMAAAGYCGGDYSSHCEGNVRSFCAETYSELPGNPGPSASSRRQEETCAVCFELNDHEAICVEPPGTPCTYGATRAECEPDGRILQCEYVGSIQGTMGAVLQAHACPTGSHCIEAATGALCQPIEVPSLPPSAVPGS
jgi:hypothetical protein